MIMYPYTLRRQKPSSPASKQSRLVCVTDRHDAMTVDEMYAEYDLAQRILLGEKDENAEKRLQQPHADEN